MERIIGIIGRDELIEETRREIKNGRHVLLFEPVWIGKSTVRGLGVLCGQADKRTSGQADKRTSGQADKRTSGQADKRTSGQADTALPQRSPGQGAVRGDGAARMLDAKALGLLEKYHGLPPVQIEWNGIKCQVNRCCIGSGKKAGCFMTPPHEEAFQ